ncbi:hypothetical protein [Halomonas sp. NO4]|uniref:hypothetical protein n=1 Tax=Halomonas sp. NO4 TaxID=2484813 RepID=UPI0013D39EF3|nr:hypothetical protein [Halomonas sp. NO4]
MKIECLSVIPGYGKSSKCIIELNNSSPNDFNMVFVPLLSEIKERYLKECPNANLVEPLDDNKTKFDSLKEVLKEECNVITTHKMYERIDAEVVGLINKKCRFKGKKTLYIDETMDVVSPSTIINNDDMKLFEELGLISINEDTGKVSALKEFPSRYKNTFNVIENGLVYFLDGRYVVFEIGIDFLQCFDRVVILTHRFKTSIMYHYIKTEGRGIHFLDVDKGRVRKLKEDARKRIVIVDDINIDSKMSHSGFDSDPEMMKRELNRVIKEAMDKTGVSLEDTRYTFFKSFGGMDAKAVNRWVKTLKIGKGEQNEDGSPKAFLAHSAKATNDHSNCKLMVWCLDKHINPGIPQYFSERGQKINRREWSLSQLIQWVWRSNIRVTEVEKEGGELVPNEETVYIVIPHAKSRREFIKWLNSDEEEDAETVDSLAKAQKNGKCKEWLNRNPQFADFEDVEELYHQYGAVQTKNILKERMKKAA